MGDHLGERDAADVAREQRERAVVDLQVLSPDPHQREVAPADDGGVERLVAHVHERADLDDRAAVAHHRDRLRERAGEAGGVDHEVDVAQLVGVGGLGARDPRRDIEPLLRRVDREHPPGAHQMRLDRVRLAERADADHRHAVAGPEAGRPGHDRGTLERVRDREDLGQHRDVVGHRVGDAEDAGARLEVEVLRPAAPQVRRLIGRKRVAVAVEVGAQEVGEAALAGGAVPAGAVGRGHHAVAGLERRAVARERSALPHRLDDPDVLVALDQGVRRAALGLAARVLLDLPAERVLVGAADAGGNHPQQHRARLELGGIGVLADLELVRGDERGGLDHAVTLPTWQPYRMPYTLLAGEFVIRYPDLPRGGPQPDGDTVKFDPDSPALVEALPRPSGGRPDINQGGISVRLGAIDALETHFEGAHQELAGADAARDELLRALGFTGVTFFPELPNTVESADQDRVRGHVLSNGIDANGRVIGFVEPGDAAEPDGAQVFLDDARASRSVNAALLAAGLVYAGLYSTLPASLRAEFALTARAARAAGAGIWPRATADPDGAANIADRAALEALAPWPKLFRRLVPYLD